MSTITNLSIVHQKTGDLTLLPDYPGYRCLQPDEEVYGGDIYVTPFGHPLHENDYNMPRPYDFSVTEPGNSPKGLSMLWVILHPGGCIALQGHVDCPVMFNMRRHCLCHNQ